ncbi:MAG TPA: aldehyde dehydrogenase family protein [Gaiellaceae bacterium]|nr:aldehyde dehydrogenase family protein [Gaiellaceae bacterium]
MSRIPSSGGTIALQEHALLALIRGEAQEARAAAALLRDDAVDEALRAAARRLESERRRVLDANAGDVDAAKSRLDEGALDRLALDEARLADIGRQLLAMAAMPPLERDLETWTLQNGLTVSTRRIPIGVVGANFEARPSVAVDVASQLLKSLNACVLRTGGAALQTVSVLVDYVLRPALNDAGLPGAAVGLVRAGERAGAFALVSLPRDIPLVILRGSGETTAALSRAAAANGVRTLAHAEGGGVLYVDAAADLDRACRLIDASLDRLGVCNRLNLLLVHESLGASLPTLVEAVRGRGVEVRGTEQARAFSPMPPLEEPLGHEWANDPEHVATVSVATVATLADAVAIANHETSGLAAGIVTEDALAAAAFLDTYRGTTAFWHAPTRFTDGFALTGAPETGINVDWAPGPRGPVTYRDLWLRQFRVTGDGSQSR